MARRRPFAYTDALLRVVCCVLLAATGTTLLMTSPFGYRMRTDYPVLPLAIALAGGLALVPLIAWRRFLRAFLVSAWILTAIGGYWWTLLPWDRFLTDAAFPSSHPPGVVDYLIVLSPTLLGAFYAVASRFSVMRADWLGRGAERREADRAAAASFLAGAAALVVCLGLTLAFVALLVSGTLARGVPQLRGVPAVVVAGLVALGGTLLATRSRGPVPKAHADAHAAKTGVPTAPKPAKVGRARKAMV